MAECSFPVGICESGYAVGVRSDYIEIPFRKTADMTAEEFEAFAEKIRENGMTVRAASGILPLSTRLYDREEEADFGLTSFLRSGFARLHTLGGDGAIAVIGCGAGRRSKEGETPEAAEDRFVRFVSLCAREASEAGCRCVIETLNREETDVAPTLADAVRVMEKAGCPASLGLHADFYHIMREERVENVRSLAYPEKLWHAHIACPTTRFGPRPEDGFSSDYRAFFAALTAIGYRGGVTVEARTENKERTFEEWTASVRTIRSLQETN